MTNPRQALFAVFALVFTESVFHGHVEEHTDVGGGTSKADWGRRADYPLDLIELADCIAQPRIYEYLVGPVSHADVVQLLDSQGK